MQLLRRALCSEACVSPCGLWYWPRPLLASHTAAPHVMSWTHWLGCINFGTKFPHMPPSALSSFAVEAFVSWKARGCSVFVPLVTSTTPAKPMQSKLRASSVPVRGTVVSTQGEPWVVAAKRCDRWNAAQLVKKRAEQVWCEQQEQQKELKAVCKLQVWWRRCHLRMQMVQEPLGVPQPNVVMVDIGPSTTVVKPSKAAKKKEAERKRVEEHRLLQEAIALADEERLAAEARHVDVLDNLRRVGGHCPNMHAFSVRLGANGDECVNCTRQLLNEPLCVCVGRKCHFMVCSACQLGAHAGRCGKRTVQEEAPD